MHVAMMFVGAYCLAMFHVAHLMCCDLGGVSGCGMRWFVVFCVCLSGGVGDVGAGRGGVGGVDDLCLGPCIGLVFLFVFVVVGCVCGGLDGVQGFGVGCVCCCGG